VHPYFLRSLLVCASLALLLTALPIVNSADEFPLRAGIFRTRLQSDKTLYRIGEPIKLRLTVTNITARPYGAMWLPEFANFKLIVANSQGRTLTSKGTRVGYNVSYGDIAQFPPGKTLVSKFVNPEAGNKSLSEWAPIEYWGYDLGEPGDYTITALPSFGAFEVIDNGKSTGSEFSISPADKSNVVHITIER